jgi:hypothetical protein
MTVDLPSLLQALILAGILWQARATYKTSKSVDELRVFLVGLNGNNGLNKQVQDIQRRLDELAA